MNIIRFFSCFIIAAAQVSAFFAPKLRVGRTRIKRGLEETWLLKIAINFS